MKQGSSVKLSHIAIACPDLDAALEKFRSLQLELETTKMVPTEKVKVGFLPVEISSHLRIELLEPSDPSSPIANFLSKRTSGGLHHICFEVNDLESWEAGLKQKGIEILPPGIRPAARGRALFIHPKSMAGVLVELEELAS